MATDHLQHAINTESMQDWLGHASFAGTRLYDRCGAIPQVRKDHNETGVVPRGGTGYIAQHSGYKNYFTK